MGAKDKKILIFRILVLLWMVVIFCFSAADGNESKETSGWAGRMIGHFFHSDFDEWSKAEQDAYVERVEYPIRKSAHASEYAVLALLVFGALRLKGFLRFLVSWSVAAVYAVTDELHQLFVPGRAGTLFDVGVDCLGALTGLLLLALILKISQRFRKKPS